MKSHGLARLGRDAEVRTLPSAESVVNLSLAFSYGKKGLEPRKTPAYDAMLMVATGAGHKQSAIAEFIEDWREAITCFGKDDAPIGTPKAIAAVRRLSIESIRRAESSVEQLSEQRSAFESVAASSTELLPQTIHYTCAPYDDLELRTFVLRLGVKTGDDKPLLTVRRVKAAQHNAEMAEELGRKITASFDGHDLPIVLGTYSKAA